MQSPPESPHPHTMMTSDEVDWLVYSYLQESGYTHTSFSLLHESALAGPSTSSSTQANGRKHHSSGVFGTPVPPGHLVRILQKGLLYLEAEARYRGDPSEPSPRLIGYPIPNALPLPPLPKNQPPPPAPTPPAAAPPPVAEEASAPGPSRGPTSKDKGKGKEKEIPNGKRKGSDREDSGDGKRPRTSSGDKKKEKAERAAAERSAKVNGTADGDAMDVEKDSNPAPTLSAKQAREQAKSGGSNSARSASPAVARSISPSVPRKPKPSSSTSNNDSSSYSSTNAPPPPSAASALANLKSLKPLSTSSSAPTSPTSKSTASLAPDASSSSKSSDRRSSLPEGTSTKKQQQQAELAKVKKEEAESLANARRVDEAVSKTVEVDMSSVLQLGADDGQVVRLRGHTMPKVQPCSWNPKVPALLATGGGDSTCRIWDCPKTWKKGKGEGLLVKDNVVCKHSSAQRRADVAAVAWDPSGSLLATGSEDGIARIWTPSGDLHLVLSMHQRTIFSLKWNNLGTMLLTGSLDATVCLWELNSGKVKQQWSTHGDSVLDVDWNDDTTFASASMDKAIHLFSISRISPVHRFKGHRDEVNVVKFSPCGTLLASCSDDHSVRIWSLRNIPGLSLADKVTDADETRKIDEEDYGGVFVLEGHKNDVHSVAWAPRTKGSTEPRLLASASFDSTARLWDVDAGTCLHSFARHTDFVYSIAFSPGLGTYLATGCNDGKMDVWRVKDRKLVLEYEHPGPIYEIAWHPKGTQLAVCGRTEDVACVGFDVEQ